MSSLTAEQVTELTERINARFAEFNVGEMRVFEPVTPGVARLAFDVVEEWTAQAAAGKYLAYEQAIEGEEAEYDAEAKWNEGWEAGRESMRAELGLLEKMGGWVAPRNIDPGIEMNTDRYVKPLAESHPDVPLHINGDVGNFRLTNGNGHHADPEQIRADIKDLGAAYPSLEDEPNGKDIFDGVHPVTGGPEPEPIIGYDETPTVMDAETFNAMKDKLGLSPATVATLGPEHTVVTPLIPRRPRTLAEVDADENVKTLRMGADERAAQLREIVGCLQDMADHGEMPSMAAWDERKPSHLPKADAITKRWDFSWGELATYCRLKFTGKRMAKSIGR